MSYPWSFLNILNWLWYVYDQRGLKCQPWFALKYVSQPYILFPVIQKAGNMSNVTVLTFILL